jgi:uroporphyrinogen-III synthase
MSHRMIILNTRPQVYQESFAKAFGCFGAPIIQSPLLDAQDIQAWPLSADDFDAVLLTSPYALRLCPPHTDWQGKTVFAVGAASAAAARIAGFQHVVCTGHTADDMIAILKTQTFRYAFYPSGEDVTMDLTQIFGERVSRCVVYRMNFISELSANAQKALLAPSEIIIPLFSRRSAEAFAKVVRTVGLDRRGKLAALGISASAISIPSPPWDEEIVAAVPTSASMALALARHLTGSRLAA